MHSLPLFSSTTPSVPLPSPNTPQKCFFFHSISTTKSMGGGKTNRKQTEQVEIHPYHLMSLKNLRIKWSKFLAMKGQNMPYHVAFWGRALRALTSKFIHWFALLPLMYQGQVFDRDCFTHHIQKSQEHVSLVFTTNHLGNIALQWISEWIENIHMTEFPFIRGFIFLFFYRIIFNSLLFANLIDE